MLLSLCREDGGALDARPRLALDFSAGTTVVPSAPVVTTVVKFVDADGAPLDCGSDAEGAPLDC